MRVDRAAAAPWGAGIALLAALIVSVALAGSHNRGYRAFPQHACHLRPLRRCR
jgi:hypothetical protein